MARLIIHGLLGRLHGQSEGDQRREDEGEFSHDFPFDGDRLGVLSCNEACG